jgi:hypothetical protein
MRNFRQMPAAAAPGQSVAAGKEELPAYLITQSAGGTTLSGLQNYYQGANAYEAPHEYRVKSSQATLARAGR